MQPTRYPPGMKAFLYYFMPPEKPRIAGELRLRVVSSVDPASFESGSDLLLPNGRIWTRPLYCLSRFNPPLYEKLREERLVPDDLDTAISTLPSTYPKYRRSHLLYTLNDTFTIDFSNFHSVLYAITEQGVETIPFRGLFLDGRGWCKGTPRTYYTPYTGAYTITFSCYSYIDLYFHEFVGSGLARFERSTLPVHKGTRTVVYAFSR